MAHPFLDILTGSTPYVSDHRDMPTELQMHANAFITPASL